MTAALAPISVAYLVKPPMKVDPSEGGSLRIRFRCEHPEHACLFLGPRDPHRADAQLRGYQRQGLGWLDFLREFGLGGVLADDMGLGKTVQVLALLDARREPRSGASRPSIVVVPRLVLAGR